MQSDEARKDQRKTDRTLHLQDLEIKETRDQEDFRITISGNLSPKGQILYIILLGEPMNY